MASASPYDYCAWCIPVMVEHHAGRILFRKLDPASLFIIIPLLSWLSLSLAPVFIFRLRRRIAASLKSCGWIFPARADTRAIAAAAKQPREHFRLPK
jgi:hypothetical protein